MGKRGPKPRPKKILEARGSWLVRHRDGEPEPEVKIPDPPAHLNDIEIEIWDYYTNELIKLGIAAEIDCHALAAFCQACATLAIVSPQVREEGYIVVQSTGSIAKNPKVTVMEKAIAQIYQGAERFGFCPSGRVGLKSKTQKEEKSDKARFFKQGKTG